MNIALVVLLIAAGIAIYILVKKSEAQQRTINGFGTQIDEQKELHEKQIEKQKVLYEEQIGELKERHAAELSARDELFKKQLNDMQNRIEVHREELYQKNEKDLLVDVMLGIEAMNNSQKSVFSKLSGDLEGVKTIKDNMYNIGDSILNDISTAHKETVAKLGVHGDMTVASILADILELMSKR